MATSNWELTKWSLSKLPSICNQIHISHPFSHKGILCILVVNQKVALLFTLMSKWEKYNQRSGHLQCVEGLLCRKMIPVETLVSVRTDRTPAMMGCHLGFIVHCKADPDFPKFLSYHCIIPWQALWAEVMGFDNVMVPVVNIINSPLNKGKTAPEHQAAPGGMCFRTWGSPPPQRHQKAKSGSDTAALSFVAGWNQGFVETREEGTTLLSHAVWLLDPAFLTDVTEKINHLNLQLQSKDKKHMRYNKCCEVFQCKTVIIHSVSETLMVSALRFSLKEVRKSHRLIQCFKCFCQGLDRSWQTDSGTLRNLSPVWYLWSTLSWMWI